MLGPWCKPRVLPQGSVRAGGGGCCWSGGRKAQQLTGKAGGSQPARPHQPASLTGTAREINRRGERALECRGNTRPDLGQPCTNEPYLAKLTNQHARAHAMHTALMAPWRHLSDSSPVSACLRMYQARKRIALLAYLDHQTTDQPLAASQPPRHEAPCTPAPVFMQRLLQIQLNPVSLSCYSCLLLITMGGVHFVNETGRDKIVIVFTVVWVPLPAAYYREIVRLAPGEEKWVPTFGGHANVFAWPSTGDAGKDRLIMDTLGKVSCVDREVGTDTSMIGALGAPCSPAARPADACFVELSGDGWSGGLGQAALPFPRASAHTVIASTPPHSPGASAHPLAHPLNLPHRRQ